MMKFYKIKKDPMTVLLWRLHCKHQTQSTPCTSAFSVNLEHETVVLVDSNTYVRRSARSADDNEDTIIKKTFSFVIINSDVFIFTAQSFLRFSGRSTLCKSYIFLSRL